MAQAATGNALLRFSSEIARTRRSRLLFLTSPEPIVRYAADFARALGAARTARNARTAQAATGDVVLRYSSQVRFNCSAVSVVSLAREAPWGVSVQQGAQQAYLRLLSLALTCAPLDSLSSSCLSSRKLRLFVCSV